MVCIHQPSEVTARWGYTCGPENAETEDWLLTYAPKSGRVVITEKAIDDVRCQIQGSSNHKYIPDILVLRRFKNPGPEYYTERDVIVWGNVQMVGSQLGGRR